MVVNNRSSDAIIPMHRSSLNPNQGSKTTWRCPNIIHNIHAKERSSLKLNGVHSWPWIQSRMYSDKLSQKSKVKILYDYLRVLNFSTTLGFYTHSSSPNITHNMHAGERSNCTAFIAGHGFIQLAAVYVYSIFPKCLDKNI